MGEKNVDFSFIDFKKTARNIDICMTISINAINEKIVELDENWIIPIATNNF